MFRLGNASTFFSFKAHLREHVKKNSFSYLNTSFSFTSLRAKGSFFIKKYVQKKPFLSKANNNCEEINL